MKYAICLLLVAIALASPGLITYNICSGASAIGSLTNVTIINNPVVPGTNTTVFGSGVISKEIRSGTWTLTGSYMGIPVLRKKGDLCTDSVISLPFKTGEIYINGLTCPAAAGEISVVERAIFFKSPPSGLYNIKCQMKDSRGDEILCLDIDIPM